MAIQQELGQKGEALAVEFLEAKGFRILQRNWRWGHSEIDIIAEKDGRPHFVEVKTRTATRFGHPEAAVNRKKIRDLFRAVEAYLRQFPKYRDFRVDVLSIVLRGEKTEYFFIEDVYW